MGCQCIQKEKGNLDNEIKQNDEYYNNIKDIENENSNSDKNDDLIDLRNHGWQILESKNINTNSIENNINTEQENINNENTEQLNLEETNKSSKNEKYANYPQQMLKLINKIRTDPKNYANEIENSIKNIVEIENHEENKPKYIYKKKIKVALVKGEPAFKQAAEQLRKINPLPPLELKNEICVALPEKEEDIKDPSYLHEQIRLLKENTNVDVFFKDLIKIPEISALLMIVDDSAKNPGKKRQAVLNPDYKYVGISSKVIGKTFIAYFTFSKKL